LQNDRVVESEEHKYSYPAPNVTIHDQKWFKVDYDAEGHLKKKYNKYKTYERANFSWGRDGNLVTVYFHGESNETLQHIWYGRSIETGKLQLPPVRSGLDPYLKIFGIGSKNMMHILQRYSPGLQHGICFSTTTSCSMTRVPHQLHDCRYHHKQTYLCLWFSLFGDTVRRSCIFYL
jgi:hypothetical protein